jgi:hypothetical protein
MKYLIGSMAGEVMNLKSRVERLEAASPDDIASRLGGTAIVTRLDDGRYQLPDKRVLTRAELDAELRGCTGRLLVLDSWQ